MALIHLVVARAANFLRRPIDMGHARSPRVVGVARRALGVRITLSDQPGERCKRTAPAVGAEIVVGHRLAPIQAFEMLGGLDSKAANGCLTRLRFAMTSAAFGSPPIARAIASLVAR